MYFADPSNLKEDALAALSTAIVSLPGNIIFGMIAFAPLGPAYRTAGIMAGWICSIVLGGFSGLFSRTEGLIAGPRAGVSLAVAAFLGELLYSAEGMAVPQALGLLVLVLLTAGLLQTFLGLLRAGTVIKYISYPVIVGVINSKVLLLLKSQFWHVLGTEKVSPLETALGRANPYSIGLTALTVLFFLILRKGMPRLPAHLFAILMGCLGHHALIRWGVTAAPGETLSSFSSGYANLFYAVARPEIFRSGLVETHLRAILISAGGIAVLSSTDTLLTALTIQNVTYQSVNANRELVVQGLGNLLAVFSGGIVGGGSSTRSMTNVAAGGRNKISPLLYSLLLLGALTYLAPLIRYIPLSVIAGLVIIIAGQMFDPWFLKGFRRCWTPEEGWNTVFLGNLGVVGAIIVLAFLTDLAYATLAGVAISFFLYVYNKSKVSVLKKTYTGARLRSKTRRPGAHRDLLTARGSEIRLARLEGSLFFGTADRLSAQIEELAAGGARYIILDFKRVSDVDASGVKILERLSVRTRKRECRLLFSYLPEDSPLREELRGLAPEGEELFFSDSDGALEFCEDRLIRAYLGSPSSGEKLLFDAFEGFSPEDFRVIRGLLTKRAYREGDRICRQGDPSDGIYFISEGAAAVSINLRGRRGEKKLETLCPGTAFGEMGLIEKKPRSANVKALGRTSCLVLSDRDFVRLKREAPGTYGKMVDNLLKTLSSRLRYANAAISELES